MFNGSTIAVRGVGKVSQPPDLTIVTFDMSALDMEYERSVADLNERVAALRNRLVAANVDPKELKTTSFDIDAVQDYRKEKRVFIGWKTRHFMRIELPIDRDLLNGVLSAIASDEIESEVAVHFEVSNKKRLREQILQDATRDARRNAESIAAAAGCRLGKVVSISYGRAEMRFQLPRYNCNVKFSALMDASASPDIAPENIDASDSVAAVWELLQSSRGLSEGGWKIDRPISSSVLSFSPQPGPSSIS